MTDINDSICQSKEACFSKAIIPSSKGVCTSSSDDNMFKHSNIHSCGRFAKLPRELNICGTRRWIS
jgi:hypothetical protein